MSPSYSPFTFPLRIFFVMLPLPMSFISLISFPFTTPYSQIRSAVDSVIRSAEKPKSLQSRQHTSCRNSNEFLSYPIRCVVFSISKSGYG